MKPAPIKSNNPLTDIERAQNLRETLDKKPKGIPIRVFGYGSLLWNPIVSFKEFQKVKLTGWSRKICTWTIEARGSLKKPGLVFGLDKDDSSSCEGLLFEFHRETMLLDLAKIWKQEMHTNLYTPRWLPVSAKQRKLLAITFVVNQNHPLYAGNVSNDMALDIICNAHGAFGACSDYFIETARALNELGLNDRKVREINELINTRIDS